MQFAHLRRRELITLLGPRPVLVPGDYFLRNCQ